MLDNAKSCDKCGTQVMVGIVTEASGSAPAQTSVPNLILPASILRRLSNLFIDRFASYIPFLIYLGYIVYSPGFVKSEYHSYFYYGALISYFGYYLICESIWQQTLGKVITKTKVVDRNGNKPDFLRILGRSFARYIPFEPFSYLFNGYPVGWHDSLSKTLVVPVHLTPEDVQKMNFEEIKKLKSNNAFPVIIIGVFGILIAIAVIGVLSSVVLVSLSSARGKALDATYKVNLANFMTQAEQYNVSHGSYSGLCKDKDVLLSLVYFPKSSDINKPKFTCNDSEKEYAASAPKKDGGEWCIDNKKSQPAKIEKVLGASTSCSEVLTSANNLSWLTYYSINDGFSVLFPGQPLLDSKDNLPITNTSATYNLHSYTSVDKNVSFLVNTFIYSENLNITDPDKILGQYLKSVTNSKDSKLISSNYTYQDSNRALDFSVQIADEIVKGRYILTSKSIYLVMMDYFPEDYNQKIYDDYINSFKILKHES